MTPDGIDAATLALLPRVDVGADDDGPAPAPDQAPPGPWSTVSWEGEGRGAVGPGPRGVVRLAVAALLAEAAPPSWSGPAEGGVLLGTDDEVAELNARFRDRPRPTNVLSFPAGPIEPGSVPPAYLGDLAFAHGVAAREADQRGQDLAAYLAVLAVHGAAHLIGHDHGSDGEAEAMEALEARALARLGLPNPYADE